MTTRMRRRPPSISAQATKSGLDGFSEADLVGKDRALGEGRFEREKRSLDLMRIEVHLRVEQCASELLGIGGRMPLLSSCA